MPQSILEIKLQDNTEVEIDHVVLTLTIVGKHEKPTSIEYFLDVPAGFMIGNLPEARAVSLIRQKKNNECILFVDYWENPPSISSIELPAKAKEVSSISFE